MYIYKIKLDRVIDGDTIDAWIDLGFDIQLHERIRFVGIDAPETRTLDSEEKQLGFLAKDYVETRLKSTTNLVLISHEFNRGKYGRIIGDILVDGESLVGELLNENLVNVYK